MITKEDLKKSDLLAKSIDKDPSYSGYAIRDKFHKFHSPDYIQKINAYVKSLEAEIEKLKNEITQRSSG